MFYVFHRGIFNVTNLLANCCPLIRMFLIRKGTQLEPYVAIRLIKIALLEFFYNYFALHFQYIWVKRQAQHSVAFEPKTGFNVGRWYGQIIICYVCIGEGVVFTTHEL